MRRHGPQDPTGKLRCDVHRYFPPGNSAFDGIGKRYGRIEVCAGDRSKCKDKGDERSPGCDGVGKQRDRSISGGQTLAHDAGAHYCCHKKRCAKKFGREPARERRRHCWPILSISFLIASLSRACRGRLRNRLILRSSMKNASRNAFSICSGVPVTAAGSGTPQCAVIGWPGQTGHTSFAALSQTVKTKSKCGASGLANSSQFLLRSPPVGRCAISSWRSAAGCTAPFARLPALYAVKFGKPFRLSIASAMIERAEFPVQRNKTLKCPVFPFISHLPGFRQL